MARGPETRGPRNPQGKPPKESTRRQFVQKKSEVGVGRPPVARPPAGIPSTRPVVPQSPNAAPNDKNRIPGQKPQGQQSQQQAKTTEAPVQGGIQIPGERSDKVTARNRPQTDEQVAEVAANPEGATPEEQKEELSRVGLAKHPGERPGVTIQPGAQPVQELPGLTAKKEFTVDRNMSIKEVETGPVGIIHTPLADLEKSEDGTVSVKEFSEEGKIRIAKLKKQQEEEFGDYPNKGDPNAPKPPVQPGIPFFNPYTGQWGGFPNGRDSLDDPNFTDD